MPWAKILSFLLSISFFILVVLYVEPPASWAKASTFQIMAFFIPLLFSATLLIDLLFKYLPHSFILSLGLVLGLAFYAVNQLNYLTFILILLITVFLWRVFPKMRLPRFRLTRETKIPKLHMRKQEQPKLRGIRRLRS